MPTANVYAVCAVNDIANRRCKGFHLLRRFPDGVDRPWHILIVRWDRKLYGYVNSCPHQGINLDFEPGEFFCSTGARLICGKHGSLFDIPTGHCGAGPCAGADLEKIDLRVVEGDICVAGVELVEE